MWGDADNLRRAHEGNFLEWDGAYLPEYKIQPDVLATDENGQSKTRTEKFSVHNRVLSMAEIAAIHNAGINGKVKARLTATGANSAVQVGEATATFQSVNQSAPTSSITLDPATLPALPTGFAHSGLAYELQTLTDFSGTINLCFQLPAFNNSVQFDTFRVLHREGANWTTLPTTRNFASRQACAPTSGFSPFALAFNLAPTAASVSISGRVFTPDGRGLRNARVTFTAADGATRTALSNPFGYYRFDEVAAGATYIFQLRHKRYSFAPQVVNVTEELTELNFTAQQ